MATEENNDYAENNVWAVDTEVFEPVKQISDRDEAHQRFNKLFKLLNRCGALHQSVRNLKRLRDQTARASNRQRINEQIREAEAEIAEKCGDIEARFAEARAALAAFPPTGISHMRAFNKPTTGGVRQKMSKGQKRIASPKGTALCAPATPSLTKSIFGRQVRFSAKRKTHRRKSGKKSTRRR